MFEAAKGRIGPATGHVDRSPRWLINRYLGAIANRLPEDQRARAAKNSTVGVPQLANDGVQLLTSISTYLFRRQAS